MSTHLRRRAMREFPTKTMAFTAGLVVVATALAGCSATPGTKSNTPVDTSSTQHVVHTVAPRPTPTSFDMNFSGTITDPDGYQLALSVHIEVGKATTSTENAPPGYTDVIVPATGTLTVKNLTQGHNYQLNVQGTGLSDTGGIAGDPLVVMNTSTKEPMTLGVLESGGAAAGTVYTVQGGQAAVLTLGRAYPSSSPQPANTIEFEVKNADVQSTVAAMERPVSALVMTSGWDGGITGGLKCGNGTWYAVVSTVSSPTCTSFVVPGVS